MDKETQYLVENIIVRVLNNLIHDPDLGEYHEDFENWMLTLTERDYNLLRNSLSDEARDHLDK